MNLEPQSTANHPSMMFAPQDIDWDDWKLVDDDPDATPALVTSGAMPSGASVWVDGNEYLNVGDADCDNATGVPVEVAAIVLRRAGWTVAPPTPREAPPERLAGQVPSGSLLVHVSINGPTAEQFTDSTMLWRRVHELIDHVYPRATHPHYHAAFAELRDSGTANLGDEYLVLTHEREPKEPTPCCNPFQQIKGPDDRCSYCGGRLTA